MSENRTELMMYQTEDGQTKIDVRMENETVWLSLDQMAELFQRDKSTISRHIRLPRPVSARHTVPHLGQFCSEGISDQRLCHER